MKLSDWVVRALVVTAFVGLLVSPDKWGFPLLLISFAVVGAWSILYPQGALGWAKTAHPKLDVEDESLWWIPRLIGACFLGMVLVIAVLILRRK